MYKFKYLTKKILKYYNELIIFIRPIFFASFLETLFKIPASKTKSLFSF